MIVIFTVYIFSQIFEKLELSENIYNAKISTFTVRCVLLILGWTACIPPERILICIAISHTGYSPQR